MAKAARISELIPVSRVTLATTTDCVEKAMVKLKTAKAKEATVNATAFHCFCGDKSSGTLMGRCIHWFRASNQTRLTRIIRKLIALALSILLSATLIGIYPVILGAKEWKQQEIALVLDAKKMIFNPFTDIIRQHCSKRIQQIDKNLGKVFVVTNESHLEESRKKLSEKPKQINSCHLGCAGWHNFDIMCQRESSYGVIFDYDPQNSYFIESTSKILVMSKNRQDFVNQVTDFANLGGVKLDTDIKRIKAELNREGSWLSKDHYFEHIKKLAGEGKIATITVDILNTDKFKELYEILTRKYSIDTVYLSNIRVFIKNENRSLFVNSVNSIVKRNTLVINCPEFPKNPAIQNNWKDLNLRQTVLTGEELLAHSVLYFKKS